MLSRSRVTRITRGRVPPKRGLLIQPRKSPPRFEEMAIYPFHRQPRVCKWTYNGSEKWLLATTTLEHILGELRSGAHCEERT